MKTLGERLKAYRKSKGWTLTVLGKKIGISIATISETERNKSVPKYKTMLAYVTKTDINPMIFFSDDNVSLTRDIPPPDYGDIAGMY